VNGHLTDGELRQFIRHRLPADRVIAIDGHLAACDECRGRASTLGNASGRLAEMRTDLLALDQHLSDTEVQDYVTGALTIQARARVDEHIARCAECASDVDDLRRWAGARSGTKRRVYLAAAAALVLLLVAPFAWRWLPDRATGSAPSIAGIERLAPDVQARVRSAIAAGVAEPPAALRDVASGSETLMSGGVNDAPFQLVEPLATISVSDRPVFSWTAVPAADDYSIAVFDSSLQPAVNPATVHGTTWSPAAPLPRAREYLWQVTARVNGRSITVPMPPAPPARFRVMDGPTAEGLAAVARDQPQSHLILGLLYAQAGARAEAAIHLRQVAATNPHAAVAGRTLRRLQEISTAR
jgi:hypothetical protein